MKSFSISCFNHHTICVFLEHEVKAFEKMFDVTVLPTDIGCVVGSGVFLRKTDIGTIIHESTHLVDNLLQERLGIGKHLLLDTTELRAYLIEYIAEKLIKLVGDIKCHTQVPDKGDGCGLIDRTSQRDGKKKENLL